MKYTFYLIAISLVLSSCTDEVGAKKTLERSGYKVISVGGYDYFNGSKDTYQTRFKAIAPNGETITGTVSKGWLKGSIIRLDD